MNNYYLEQLCTQHKLSAEQMAIYLAQYEISIHHDKMVNTANMPTAYTIARYIREVYLMPIGARQTLNPRFERHISITLGFCAQKYAYGKNVTYAPLFSLFKNRKSRISDKYLLKIFTDILDSEKRELTYTDLAVGIFLCAKTPYEQFDISSNSMQAFIKKLQKPLTELGIYDADSRVYRIKTG